MLLLKKHITKSKRMNHKVLEENFIANNNKNYKVTSSRDNAV